MRQPLFGDYTFELAEASAFKIFFEESRPVVFENKVSFHLHDALTKTEHENLTRLGSRMGEPYRLQLFINKGDERIGWFTGVQHDRETFYMMNTGIFKLHQGKGIYTSLLPKMLSLLQAEGFQKVTSRHNATNNQILVPKLKVGFIISGIEINDVFGLMVHLTYFFNETRRQVMDFRTGQNVPDDDLKKLLNLT
ncbi:MAG: hypothetical protein IAF08_06105 [Rhizobacter sp.]|nr:hypothetical protein [Chlorobiales bacterium]